MIRHAMPLALALAAVLTVLPPPAAALDVDEIGSFHVGGRQVSLSGMAKREVVFTPGAPPITVDPNGDFEVEQMYVQYVRLSNPTAKYPLLLWHGGGLTGVTWETTPDGRPGWQMFFLKQGHSVFVSDAVERGRATWARYPEIFKTEPMFRTKKEAWELFRIGPADSYASRGVLPGQQFPTAAFDQFIKQSTPRWTSTDAATQAAYDALVQKVCPCVVLVHSQGGNFGFTAALNAVDRVKAVVAIEPSGAPDPARVDVARLKSVPHLFVWGDYLDQVPVWQKLMAAPQKYQMALAGGGASAEWLELPKHGIRGNSHMLMMDKNSDQVAGLIQAWLARQGLMR